MIAFTGDRVSLKSTSWSTKDTQGFFLLMCHAIRRRKDLPISLSRRPVTHRSSALSGEIGWLLKIGGKLLEFFPPLRRKSVKIVAPPYLRFRNGLPFRPRYTQLVCFPPIYTHPSRDQSVFPSSLL